MRLVRLIREAARSHRELLLFTAVGVGLVAYANLTPPAAGREVFAWLPALSVLEGDFPEYLWRFAASFVLLGLLPFAAALSCGYRPRDLGLTLPKRFARPWFWLVVLALALTIAASGAYNPGTSVFYPYSKTLLELISRQGYLPFLAHALAYFFLFYVPWEIVFRGVLVFPLVRLGGDLPPSSQLGLACLQAIPSALLHFGHPLVEVLGSVPYGVFAGYLALRTGSILPGLAVHAGIGILQDLLISLRAGGVFP